MHGGGLEMAGALRRRERWMLRGKRSRRDDGGASASAVRQWLRHRKNRPLQRMRNSQLAGAMCHVAGAGERKPREEAMLAALWRRWHRGVLVAGVARRLVQLHRSALRLMQLVMEGMEGMLRWPRRRRMPMWSLQSRLVKAGVVRRGRRLGPPGGGERRPAGLCGRI